MLLLVAGMPCYSLLFNVTQAPCASPWCTTPALLHTDHGLVLGVQPFVDQVETCNLWGGRPIVEGCWLIMEPSLYGPHPIRRALAFSIRLHWHWVDVGHIYHGMMRWGTGRVLVEGDHGLHCRVKVRVYCLVMFLISFSNMWKLSTSCDWSLVCTPTI